MKKTVLAALLASTALILLSTSTAAFASEQSLDMQTRIETVIATNPGGAQTAWDEVSWDNGATVLTLAPRGVTTLAAVGGCTSGKFCAYDQAGYTGDKITYSTCTGSQSVSALPGPVRSMANSRTSGSIKAYAGSTLLATASAGHGTNVSGTTTNISCS